MKRLLPIVLLALILATPARSTPQCHIGVFADADGTQSIYQPTQFVPFSVWVVWRDESSIEGASYRISFPSAVFVTNRYIGPDGAGFEFLNGESGPNAFDTIAAFGDCSLGFGGQAVVVARYECIVNEPSIHSQEVILEPNVYENPDDIEYATCSNTVEPCPIVSNLLFDIGGPIESRSFGAVKSLY